MSRAQGKTTVDAYPADRERLNQLAAQLTADGPGRFGQAEALKWVLNAREDLAYKLTAMEDREAYDEAARRLAARELEMP